MGEVNVQDRVMEMIVEYAEVPKRKTRRDHRFKEDLNLDSLDVIELALRMEDFFKIEIPDNDAEKLLTVGQCIDYIEGKTKGE